MSYGVRFTPPPIPSPSPSPSPSIDFPAIATHHTMLVSLLLALFLPCAGMSAVFIVYVCLLWYASSNNHTQNEFRPPVKPVAVTGLSASDLAKLPKVTGKDLVMGSECAVCLDEIEGEQNARIISGCNHGFHLQCADTWLSRQSMCPVCRAKLDSEFFKALENPC